MSFACICQYFAYIYMLLEVQLQEASELDKFHMTSKSMDSENSVFPHIHMHVCKHILIHSLIQISYI